MRPSTSPAISPLVAGLFLSLPIPSAALRPAGPPSRQPAEQRCGVGAGRSEAM